MILWGTNWLTLECPECNDNLVFDGRGRVSIPFEEIRAAVDQHHFLHALREPPDGSSTP